MLYCRSVVYACLLFNELCGRATVVFFLLFSMNTRDMGGYETDRYTITYILLAISKVAFSFAKKEDREKYTPDEYLKLIIFFPLVILGVREHNQYKNNYNQGRVYRSKGGECSGALVLLPFHPFYCYSPCRCIIIIMNNPTYRL